MKGIEINVNEKKWFGERSCVLIEIHTPEACEYFAKLFRNLATEDVNTEDYESALENLKAAESILKGINEAFTDEEEEVA